MDLIWINPDRTGGVFEASETPVKGWDAWVKVSAYAKALEADAQAGKQNAKKEPD